MIAFVCLVLLFLSGLIFGAWKAWQRQRRVASTPGLDIFLHKLVFVDREKLALMAACSDGGDSGTGHAGEALQSWELWELVGGLQGLETLAANCEVLIDLACYVQHWYPEALSVAEELRLQARELRWHVDRLRGAEVRGHLQTVFPDYAQRAVSLYCAMSERVSELYAAAEVPGWTRVQTAL